MKSRFSGAWGPGSESGSPGVSETVTVPRTDEGVAELMRRDRAGIGVPLGRVVGLAGYRVLRVRADPVPGHRLTEVDVRRLVRPLEVGDRDAGIRRLRRGGRAH